MKAAINGRGLTKIYRLKTDRSNSLKETLVRRSSSSIEEFRALNDVDIEVAKGSFHGVIGRNGSGKSTLLKLLANIHEPTSGSLDVNGRLSALLELGSGFHPELSGRDNIFLNGAILGLSRRELEYAVDGIIEFSGIEDFIDAPVKVLSSGMYVRLGFAVAVHVNPEILLIDEVIAVGDESFQRRCLEHLRQLRMQGVTIVLVSHSLPLVESLCDQVTWLERGEVRLQGTSTEVAWSYLADVEGRSALDGEPKDEPSSSKQEREIVPGRRRGRGPIRIEHVDLVASDHRQHSLPATGRYLNIRLWYEADQDVDGVSFSVYLSHSDGAFAAASLDHGAFDVRVERGTGYVDYIIEELTVLPGDYLISTFVERGETELDAWEGAFPLRVWPRAAVPLPDSGALVGAWRPPMSHVRGQF